MPELVAQRILVTGGAGFIGSHVVERLLAGGASRIVTLDKLTYAGSRANLDGVAKDARHRLVEGDVADGAHVASILRDEDVDAIVHLAAESHVDRSIVGPAPFVHTNLVGTYAVLEAARVHFRARFGNDPTRCRFHHVSTDEVYGDLGPHDPPFRVGDPYRPSSPYAASKAGADHLVTAYGRTYGLPFTITHGANAYGPRQNDEKVVPVIIRACAALRPIPIYGDGTNERDWVHVDDHARAIELAVKRGVPGATYLVGGGTSLTNLELARRICAVFDERRPEHAPHARAITFVADRPGHDRRYALATEATRVAIGWAPERAFDEGMRETVEWYLAR
jgi:dTDP-glucose 4,6-dehydratase